MKKLLAAFAGLMLGAALLAVGVDVAAASPLHRDGVYPYDSVPTQI